jgi:Flp pilus assembly protein TadG
VEIMRVDVVSGGRRERGSSTVELIVMLPVLLLILFGIVELSRAWFTLNIATTAAREGVRAGAVSPTDTGNVFNPSAAYARIDAILSAANLSSTSGREVGCATPCTSGSTVTATVTVNFSTPIPLLEPLFGSSLSIQQTATMRYE